MSPELAIHGLSTDGGILSVPLPFGLIVLSPSLHEGLFGAVVDSSVDP